MNDCLNEIQDLLELLFPINRSLSGEGNRQTLKHLQQIIPLTIHEVQSGTKVYDWTIPPEWNVKDAWIKNSKGEKLVDFKELNLSIVSYSQPIQLNGVKKSEIIEHLHTLPDMPKAVPYRTSYYNETWGFCLSQEQLDLIPEEETLDVLIDTQLDLSGSLTYGDLLIKGKSDKEILISCYICHPSMANDSLSGVIGASMIAKTLLNKDLNYSYRFIFVPETIGPIAYLSENPEVSKNAIMAFVLTTMGGPGPLGYKQSFERDHHLNEVIESTLKASDPNFKSYPFDIHGSDERQYSSAGFRIPSFSIVKDKYYDFPEYHTSLDNLDLVNASQLKQALDCYLDVIQVIDQDRYYLNLEPHGEVQLGKRGLYPKLGGAQLPGVESKVSELDLILNLLFWSDGKTPLREISRKLAVSEDSFDEVIKKLEKEKLLKLQF